MPEPNRKRSSKTSSFSKLGYILVVVALIVQFYIGFRHIGDSDSYSRKFGFFALLEGSFALIGLFTIDFLRTGKFDLYPKESFRSINDITLITFGLSWLAAELIQILADVRMTIPDYEFAFATIFAAPCEESFFRGFLISIFTWISISFNIKRYKISKKVSFSVFELVGVLVSAVVFSLLHINYYDEPQLLVSMLLTGMVFGFVYLFTGDLTGVILGHLALNIIYIGQYFWLSGF